MESGLRYFFNSLIVSLVAWAGLGVAGSAGAWAEIRVEEGYVRGMPPGQPTTAAFMRLVNDTDQDVIIDGGSSDVAERIEIHAHVHKNGMMSMKQVQSISIPARGDFILAPGDHHLMLIGLTRPLREGDTVQLTLSSGKEQVVNAELPVRSVLNEHRH